MRIRGDLIKVLEYITNTLGLKVWAATDTVEYDFGPTQWMVEKLIPSPSVIGISGSPESFKTWLTLELARCISVGESFLGQFKTTQGNVLIVDKEDHPRYVQKRLRQLSVKENDAIFNLFYGDDLFVDNEKDLKLLEEVIEKLSVKVVIFDSLIRMHRGDENESQHIAKVMGAFRKLTNDGITVIFTHHHRKEKNGARVSANSMRGSSDILAGLDCLLMIEYLKNENRIVVEQAKLRQDEKIKPFSVLIQSDKEKNTVQFAYGGEYDPSKSARQEVKEVIVNLLTNKPEIARKEFIETIEEDYSVATIDAALRELVSEDKIQKLPSGPSNKHSYSLKK